LKAARRGHSIENAGYCLHNKARHLLVCRRFR
jgi:hypothetical protein